MLIEFARGTFDYLFLDLQSSEELGILDTDYIEDYYGVDGQLTLVNLTDSSEYTIEMSQVGVSTLTPDLENDYFRGAVALQTLPNATFSIRGRVRSIDGGYTILSAYSAPNGAESTFDFQLTISGVIVGPGNMVVVGPFTARGGREVEVDRSNDAIFISVDRSGDEIIIPRNFE